MKTLEMQKHGAGRILVREDKYHEHVANGFKVCKGHESVAQELENVTPVETLDEEERQVLFEDIEVE